LNARDHRILATLDAIRTTWGAGLNDFLYALFDESTHEDVITTRAQLLKGGHLASKLIPAWVEHSPETGSAVLATTLVKFAADILRTELAVRARKGGLNLVATDLKKKDLDAAKSFPALLSGYEATMPHLNTVLRALVEEPNQGEVEKKAGASGEQKKGRADPALTAIISTLLYVHNRACNAYPTLLGLCLHSHSVPRAVIEVFHRLSLSISYQSILNCQKGLVKDKLDTVRALFAAPPLGLGRFCFLAFDDNVDWVDFVTNERSDNTRETWHVGLPLLIAVNDEAAAAAQSPDVQKRAEEMRGKGAAFLIGTLFGGEREADHDKATMIAQIVSILIEFFPLALASRSHRSAQQKETALAALRERLRGEHAKHQDQRMLPFVALLPLCAERE
ncbi:hypothetical protein JCM11641_001948, partial [Rhodosporidiobolus odoratus]